MVGDFGWEHEGTKSGVDTVNEISFEIFFMYIKPVKEYFLNIADTYLCTYYTRQWL